MISKITASTIYSTLGNNNSLVPLAMKDIANSLGLTTSSYLSGSKDEGKDRFIDEFGTQSIWLWGIPAYKKFIDLTLFKMFGLDSKVDVRILKNKEIFDLARNLAPNTTIKDSLNKVAKNKSLFKNLTIAKFGLSTLLTAVSYFSLTKFRHNYTKKQITKEILKQQQENNKNDKQGKQVSFTGGLQDFVFNPVKNLMIVDGTITAERLTHARNPQDFLGYVIKEGSFWAFMYFAGPLIAKGLEKKAEKMGKSIGLDSRILESDTLESAIKDGSLKKYINEFNVANTSDAKLYEFLVKNKDNLLVKFAKKVDLIETLKNSDTVDTRRFIDTEELKAFKSKFEKLLDEFKNSNSSLDKFLNDVRKLKRLSVLKNIGACIAVLGIIAPTVMYIARKINPEYQVKQDIEKELLSKNNAV